MPVETGGPYVGYAVLCEKILREADSVISLIRIVDRMIVEPGANAPEEMPIIPLQLQAAIGLKSGTLSGSYTLKLTLASPDGEEPTLGTFPLLFEGQDRGINVNVNLTLEVKKQGLYWIGVYVEDSILTRMPLRIIYQRIGGGTVQK